MIDLRTRTIDFLKRCAHKISLISGTRLDVSTYSLNYQVAETMMEEIAALEERLARIEKILREKLI